MLRADPLKALPCDGNPLASYPDADAAWQEVYGGIKSVIHEWNSTFTLREDFLETISKGEFLSQEHLSLRDLFVFPHMTSDEPRDSGFSSQGTTISNEEELLTLKRVLIHGEEKCGKTTLARYLCLTLIEDSNPVLIIDSLPTRGNLDHGFLSQEYQTQFTGDYSLWSQQGNKTLVIDNVTDCIRLVKLLDIGKDDFDRIIVTLSSDLFYSFFRDDSRLSDFQELKIEPLTYSQQEDLIRQRLACFGDGRQVTDGYVDQIENHVNSVIISNRILPRYPFYILSILQLYESYMPTNMAITSYGHCYHALIVANLIRSGVSAADNDINSCFNLAENLSFKLYLYYTKDKPVTNFDFDSFLVSYRERFIIADSLVNRMKAKPYGLVSENGTFKTKYMYYYFLGKFLSGNKKIGEPVIEEMCEKSYMEENYLTILFTIHHARDETIIDDILLRTMSAMESAKPAKLDREETRRFKSIVEGIPEDVLSIESVEEERKRVRSDRDDLDEYGYEDDQEREEDDIKAVNEIYRILKNNKIMGQVLRNRHGNLEKDKIEEIIWTISDSGLRLVNVVLKDEKEIADLARYLRKKHQGLDPASIKYWLEFLSFMWTIINVEAIVKEINVPEVRESVNMIVSREASASYDLIGYFSELDHAEALTEREQTRLGTLLRKHDDVFVRRVLSLRTQHYMNTHRSKTSVEQAVCSLLNIEYSPKMLIRKSV